MTRCIPRCMTRLPLLVQYNARYSTQIFPLSENSWSWALCCSTVFSTEHSRLCYCCDMLFCGSLTLLSLSFRWTCNDRRSRLCILQSCFAHVLAVCLCVFFHVLVSCILFFRPARSGSSLFGSNRASATANKPPDRRNSAHGSAGNAQNLISSYYLVLNKTHLSLKVMILLILLTVVAEIRVVVVNALLFSDLVNALLCSFFCRSTYNTPIYVRAGVGWYATRLKRYSEWVWL